MSTTHEIMMLPIAWSDGVRESLNQLSPLVEAELHHLFSLARRNAAWR